ncbi:MAG: putative YigZ family protein [Marivirga sp.]|jgi:uncharacterized YigZ family protein
MKDYFFTVADSQESLYKEKGSKFIGICFPVSSEEDVKSCQEALRKRFYDARHHCYAYIIGAAGDQYRANDDGEPNHSAGDPILGQIRSKELTNTLVVVVRYFGGTKLGVSGLINAYKTAAAEALDQSKIVKEIVKSKYLLQYGYEITNEVMRLISDFNLEIFHQDFQADCKAEIGVRLNLEGAFKEEAEKTVGLTMKLIPS